MRIPARPLALALVMLGACTHSDPLVDINADEGNSVPAIGGTSPVIAQMAATPYQGVIGLDFPAIALDAVPLDAAGAAGVAGSVVLVPSLPGGTFCATGVQHGSCCLSIGTFEDFVPALQSAGTLTVSNASEPAVPPTHGHYDDYGYSMLPPTTYAIGDQMTVSAAGDAQAIDAFVSASAAIPVPLVGLPPEFASSDWGTVGVSTSHDWTFQWAPAGASFVDIAVSGDLGGVECRVGDADGELVIPAVTLAAIATPGVVGSATVFRGNSAPIVAANVTAELDVTISRSYADVQF
ncbi:MAG TPA: hypothetical protein VGG74_07680 [Kofleriaceae bacterium]